MGWVHNEGTNGAKSMLIMWHKDAFRCDSQVEGKGFITIYGQHLKSKVLCAVVNVYATCHLKDKVALWEDLSSIRSVNQDLAWCFCGDFNVVRRASERKGSSERGSQKNEIRGFNSFINRNFLVELLIMDKKFTWFKANGSTKSRVDRALVYDGWLQSWPNCKQYVQLREVSDHYTLMVKSVDNN